MNMQKLGLHTTAVLALCGSFLLSGCPDDPAGNETDSTTGSDSTDTTMNPTTVTVTGGMTSDASSSSSSSGDTTVGLDDTSTGSSSGDTGSSSDEGSSSSGGPPADGYGDCANEPDRVACGPGEICLDAGSAAACSYQGCADAAGCPAPTTGDASAQCFDIDKDGSNDCFLDCSGGEACPDGMTCVFEFACLWQVLAPGGGMCPDEDLGNTVPQAIMGNNTGLFDDHVPSCTAGGGEDAMYQFTALVDGNYTFNTAGSGFDTSLVLLDGCGGVELACNDDVDESLTSEITIALVAGQSVIVVVDSFDGEVGPFNLNILPL